MLKRKFIISTIISLCMLFLYSEFLPGQNDDQPIGPPEFTYMAQIGWGDVNSPDFVWEDITIDEIKKLPGSLSSFQHKYSCRLLNEKNWWIWESPGSTIEAPEITAISIIPREIKNSKYIFWGYYQVRVKFIADNVEYTWSDASKWAQCLDFEYIQKKTGILNGDLIRGGNYGK